MRGPHPALFLYKNDKFPLAYNFLYTLIHRTNIVILFRKVILVQFQFITQLTQSPLSLPFGEIRSFMFIFQEFGYEDLQQRTLHSVINRKRYMVTSKW
ncbi:hypothetical protein DD86_21275 [Salmonella enterica subsp. enterica serovar Typhimurium var. 5-]|uniref:Uncharacterized protein n=2 Tax=Salmonella enterica I TaxID=59201 RepID=A0A6C8WQI8_SALTM|nr:hypothetical protein WZ82_21755 [Salmonella enterica subsp. enterica serovar Typhimurium]EMR53414.1 hypothetical protein A670_01360 [Salmonella enterica subsp. enterica serovar Dublin str. UC16]EPI67210.1 hypothetical protein A671_03512 [Salmonella enterica subsp. enterica serovar Dublin str. DG22]KHD81310.1 hypothetical protein SEET0368_14440 [Salmonella enterica subsp. enterica serovar Typhimurium str. 86-0368]KKE56443.1 hypothetical protein TJ37_09020 [Salmonella enterica subsp. enterica 